MHNFLVSPRFRTASPRFRTASPRFRTASPRFRTAKVRDSAPGLVTYPGLGICLLDLPFAPLGAGKHLNCRWGDYPWALHLLA